MDALIVKLTKETPEIIFNPKDDLYSIKGKSLPENAVDFYKPVFDWITNFSLNHPNKSIALNVDIDYMNSSSIKLIFFIFNTINKHYQSNNNTNTCINWFCSKDDELMVNKGNEFKELLELPFHIKFKN